MLKFFRLLPSFLFALLSFFSAPLALAQEDAQVIAETSDSNNEPSDLENPEQAEIDLEERRSVPRDKEYYFRQCYQRVPPLCSGLW